MSGGFWHEKRGYSLLVCYRAMSGYNQRWAVLQESIQNADPLRNIPGHDAWMCACEQQISGKQDVVIGKEKGGITGTVTVSQRAQDSRALAAVQCNRIVKGQGSESGNQYRKGSVHREQLAQLIFFFLPLFSVRFLFQSLFDRQRVIRVRFGKGQKLVVRS
ncbi:hypothetical protein PSE45_26425 [Brevibacillus parabrevis]|nr:hypothetical protein [Brevibacillus parabrevis]WDV95130.1 hypothetical protein PSE45_26425 [Brevibacillus parabrevis]